MPSLVIAFLGKNFRNAEGGSCAPRAIPGVGVANKISSLRSMCFEASPAERPIHHTAVLGDSEILFENCSMQKRSVPEGRLKMGKILLHQASLRDGTLLHTTPAFKRRATFALSLRDNKTIQPCNWYKTYRTYTLRPC